MLLVLKLKISKKPVVLNNHKRIGRRVYAESVRSRIKLGRKTAYCLTLPYNTGIKSQGIKLFCINLINKIIIYINKVSFVSPVYGINGTAANHTVFFIHFYLAQNCIGVAEINVVVFFVNKD